MHEYQHGRFQHAPCHQQISRTSNAAQPANTRDSAAAKLTVQPQNTAGPSKISVKPRFLDARIAMSPSEQNALDNLLKIINEKNASNAGYSRNNEVADNPELIGRLIDVKV